MQVEAWMSRRVHTVKPQDSIQHARELMETNRVNQLPVVVAGRVLGIATDRDLRDAFPSVFEAARSGRQRDRSPSDPSVVEVESVMTQPVITLGPKDSVVEAARIMQRERIGAVPVVDGGHLVGIIARSDILRAFIELAESRGNDVVKPGR